MGGLMKDPNVGKLIVPIVPDEGQTFGLPPLYNQFGIYSPLGQIYEPVDKGTMTEYREATNGPDLPGGDQRGREHGHVHRRRDRRTARSACNTIPFYVYYSMFGFQRVGDLIWARPTAAAAGS